MFIIVNAKLATIYTPRYLFTYRYCAEDKAIVRISLSKQICLNPTHLLDSYLAIMAGLLYRNIRICLVRRLVLESY
jgi:hypothetical protein